MIEEAALTNNNQTTITDGIFFVSFYIWFAVHLFGRYGFKLAFASLLMDHECSQSAPVHASCV